MAVSREQRNIVYRNTGLDARGLHFRACALAIVCRHDEGTHRNSGGRFFLRTHPPFDVKRYPDVAVQMLDFERARRKQVGNRKQLQDRPARSRRRHSRILPAFRSAAVGLNPLMGKSSIFYASRCRDRNLSLHYGPSIRAVPSHLTRAIALASRRALLSACTGASPLVQARGDQTRSPAARLSRDHFASP